MKGPKEGEKLVEIPSTLTTWKKWKTLHPETRVYIKRSNHRLSDFTSDTFAKLAKKGGGPVENTDLVLGVEGGHETKAYLIRYLAKHRLINDTLESQPIVVFLSQDFATTRVLDRSVKDQKLAFSLEDGGDRLRDAETGSVWDSLTGEAVSGSFKGERLNPLISTTSLWYAWKTYRPNTQLVGER